MMIDAPNYHTGEGDCQCGCGMSMLPELVMALQSFNKILSRAYGAPIRHIITSGARCVKRNASTDGASSTSQHVHGKAADGHWEQYLANSWRRLDSRDVAQLAIKSGLFGGVGWLRYRKEGTFIVHLDLRNGTTVQW